MQGREHGIVQDDLGGNSVFDKYHCHDVWAQWSITNRCNLSCVYCLAHDHSVLKNEKVPAIDIAALIRTLDKTGKIFKMRFTGGGEPFLVPNIVEACVELTKKHYVGFNTNLTCSNVKDFAEQIDPEKVFNIRASIHINELERLNLVEKCIQNFLLCREKGFNIVAIMIAYPPILPEIEKYEALFNKQGIKINFNLFIGTYNGKEYPKSYTETEIERFGLNRISLQKYYEYKGICNAGYNAILIMPNGNVCPCFYKTGEIMGNVYKQIKFKRCLAVCPVQLCNCPFKQIDPYLFKRALEESPKIPKLITFTQARIISYLRRNKLILILRNAKKRMRQKKDLVEQAPHK